MLWVLLFVAWLFWWQCHISILLFVSEKTPIVLAWTSVFMENIYAISAITEKNFFMQFTKIKLLPTPTVFEYYNFSSKTIGRTCNFSNRWYNFYIIKVLNSSNFYCVSIIYSELSLLLSLFLQSYLSFFSCHLLWPLPQNNSLGVHPKDVSLHFSIIQ